MIEEPKKPGFYWALIDSEEGVSEQPYLEIVERDGDFWYSASLIQIGIDWVTLTTHLPVLRIEPVTPPSWERKP